MKSGDLNLLEPSGPVQACNGISLPLPFYIICLQQVYHSGGEMDRMGPISGLTTHENSRNKLNTTQGLQFINRSP